MIYLDEADLDYISSTKGVDVRIFEREMAEYLDVDDCVAVNSGTSALHLALLACGVNWGYPVAVPATTFVATANAVLYTGATVKLVDIELKNWGLPHEVIKNTDAVVPVSLYGGEVTYSILFDDYPVILDLAEGLGSIMGKNGTVDYSCYSFNGNKTMTTGGGGLIVGGDLDKIRRLMRPAYCNKLAYNYGMPAVNARLGLEQLKKLNEYLIKKETFNNIYREELSFLTFQEAAPGPYWMTACIFPCDAKEFRLKLAARDIPTRRIFKPLNHYSHIYELHGVKKKYKNAEYLYKHGLCLPSSVRNTEKDIMYVCKTIKEVLK
jgi:perosamine synthetase